MLSAFANVVIPGFAGVLKSLGAFVMDLFLCLLMEQIIADSVFVIDERSVHLRLATSNYVYGYPKPTNDY